VTNDKVKAAATIPPPDKTLREQDEDLHRFDITTEERVSYLWNGYRYSSAVDAIAAAKQASR